MMGVQEYLEILCNIRDCAFATVDCTGEPAVHCGLCFESCPVEAIERLGGDRGAGGRRFGTQD